MGQKEKMSLKSSQETYQNKEWLEQEYITKDRFAKDIAKECRVSEGAISRWTTKFKLGKTTIHKSDYKNKVWLHHEYIILRKTKNEIAKQQGVGEKTIERWRSKFKIIKLISRR